MILAVTDTILHEWVIVSGNIVTGCHKSTLTITRTTLPGVYTPENVDIIVGIYPPHMSDPTGKC